MTSRERLLATLRGEPVDRPAVSFYEIGGFCVDPTDPDPFNIYNDPSWAPLLIMAETQTDLIRMMNPVRKQSHSAWTVDEGEPTKADAITRTRETIKDGSRFVRTTVDTPQRRLTSLQRRDPDTDTVWTVEPLLKDIDDLKAYLSLPEAEEAPAIDVAPLIREEEKLGDRGMVMVDTEDPLCAAATLFDLADYTLIALQEQALFHKLLERFARQIHRRTEAIAKAFPGRLWRIYGSEYAAEPYLPPALFEEYVVRYTVPMVRAIHAHGGFVRIHCHGRIKNILDMMVRMGADAIDPVEPPPYGDITLEDIRKNHGDDLVLFGNIEATHIENMAGDAFRALVIDTVRQGTSHQGRGFVLMPTASPFRRVISAQILENFQIMLDVASGGAQ